MKTKHIQHLYQRAAFGIRPQKLKQLQSKDRKRVVKELFSDSKNYTPLKIDTRQLEDELYSMNKPTKANIRELIKKSRKKINEYNFAWMNRLMQPEEALRERMTLFWANHFVCTDNNILHLQQYNNTLRKNALGNFGNFLKAIAKEPSMLKYLNNKQNKKARPNENFARELQELFTLGTGHYSEKDIKEAARAFTGWNHNMKGDFILRKKQHDFGKKTFLGKTGNFNGDDIIDIILEQEQCANFICTKIYRYFVNEQVNNDHIREMIKVFYPEYDISSLMNFVFNAGWFYEPQQIGTKIKSPVDLITGINNVVGIQFNKPKELLYIQKLLNQVLLRPPNVAGWKGGRTWIDTNTLMIRLKLASVLLNNAVIALDEKGDPEDTYQMYYNRMNKRKRKLEATAQWDVFESEFQNLSVDEIKEFILPSKINSGTEQLIKKLKTDSKQQYTIQLMSLPEYQLC